MLADALRVARLGACPTESLSDDVADVAQILGAVWLTLNAGWQKPSDEERTVLRALLESQDALLRIAKEMRQ